MRRLLFLLALASACAVSAANAQSLCDLMPAAQVQSTLGLTTPLTATPNTEGGNGCDYKDAAAGPVIVMADSSDDSG